MSTLQIKEICSYETTGEIEESSLLHAVHEQFHGSAYVYVVMDYAVALGLYTDRQIHIKLNRNQEITDLPIAYLQELRVFKEDREFRALRHGKVFQWRLRVDGENLPGSQSLYRLDEVHKLWGAVKEDTDQGTWSRLSTQRGSSIYFPGFISLHGEKGILVRNYIQFRSADDENGLVQYVDERLCHFIDWPCKDGEV